MLCEIFSPVRMVPTATRRGFRQGWSMDIAMTCPTTGRKWDLSKLETQEEVCRMIRGEKPYFIIDGTTVYNVLKPSESELASRPGRVCEEVRRGRDHDGVRDSGG